MAMGQNPHTLPFTQKRVPQMDVPAPKYSTLGLDRYCRYTIDILVSILHEAI